MTYRRGRYSDNLLGRRAAAEAVVEEVFLALWRDPAPALSQPLGIDRYLAEAVRGRACPQLNGVAATDGRRRRGRLGRATAASTNSVTYPASSTSDSKA